MVRRFGLALLCGCVLGAGAGNAHAASLWDDAAGSLAGWQVVPGLPTLTPGEDPFVSVVDNAFVPASASGGAAYRLLLSTGSYIDDSDGVNAPSVGEVETFLGGASVDVGGHPGFDAGGAVEGSAAKTAFTAHGGDTLTISFDFLTAEGVDGDVSGLLDQTDDFAFLALTNGGSTQVTRLADVLTPGMQDILLASNYRYQYHTGFQTARFTLPSAGPGTTYTLSLGVMDGTGRDGIDVLGHIGESALLVQSIDVSGPTAAVPVPAAAPAGAVLVGIMAAVRRVRRRRR